MLTICYETPSSFILDNEISGIIDKFYEGVISFWAILDDYAH